MKHNTRRLTLLTLFVSIEIVIAVIPFLGYIPLGVINATTLHIPVIIAGILLGKKEGSIVGFVFGLTSLVKNTLQPTLTSFAFTPFITVGDVSGGWQSLFIALVPRILIGFLAGWLFELLHKKMKETGAIALSAIVASLANTILVLGSIYFLFGVDYANALNVAYNTLFSFIMGIVTTSGIAEAIIAAIISVVICKAGKKAIRL